MIYRYVVKIEPRSFWMIPSTILSNLKNLPPFEPFWASIFQKQNTLDNVNINKINSSFKGEKIQIFKKQLKSIYILWNNENANWKKIIGMYYKNNLEKNNYFSFQDEGLVIQCLIKSRDVHQDLDDKCVAAVEHWQILSMKDWRFSYQFKDSCKKDIQEHCFSMNAGKNKLIIGLVLIKVAFFQKVPFVF